MNIPSEIILSDKAAEKDVTDFKQKKQNPDGKGERLYRIYSALDEIRGTVKNLSVSGIYSSENVSYFGDIILVTICINGEK